MTLVSAIIKRAYRETNLIPLVGTPNANQTTEALEHLNPLILSSVGFEAGDDLVDLNYGGTHDQSDCINQWIPDNVRLMLNLEGTLTLDADPYPFEGQRLAVVDSAGNLTTYPLTIDGNGRKIEGAATVTLNTDDETRQWLYTAEAGWVRIQGLADDDEMPFPDEFDPFFIIMLAARLNPAYGQALAPETVKMLSRARSILRSRYTRKNYNAPCDAGLLDPKEYSVGGMRSFNVGYPYPGPYY